jgi:cytoskeletal protein CcmA (bactofilin family)
MHMSQIGPSIHVKGEISAEEPLTIAGRVEGSIKVDGQELTVVPGCHIAADITAERVVIGGEVRGRVNAETSIAVLETGSVEGELVAPSVRLTEGAYVHGRVETAEKKPLPLLRTA